MSMINKYLKIYIYLLISYNSVIMEYQKMINLLDNKPIQPTKFRTKSCIEINIDSCGTYNKGSQIKCKLSLLKLVYKMQVYLLKGLYQLQHKQEIIQIIDIKK